MTRFLRASAMLGVLPAAIASTAVAAPYYQTQIQGDTFTYNSANNTLTPGSFAQVSPDTTAPSQIGATHTTYQVGASAVATNGGSAGSNIQLAPAPRVNGVSYAQDETGQSTIVYQFTISGPANTALPVEIKANGAISWNQNGAADALFSFQDYYNRTAATSLRSEINQNDPTQTREKGTMTFSVDSTLYLNSGDTYSVVLSTSVSADVRQFANFTDYANENAFVDPTFTVLGPTANLYSFQGIPASAPSVGGGGSSPVPEPAGWAIMVLGLAFVAARPRRPGTATGTRAAA